MPFSSSRLAPLLAAVGLAAILTSTRTAEAAPPLSEEDFHAAHPPLTGPRGGIVEWPQGRMNYLFELDQIAAFLDDWQVKDTGSPDFGGMIEAEGGSLGGVIQTDNTLEAIWLWSRYTELTGRTTYLQNIADAWVYCETYPAWLEEGPVNGYYRAHNCAWALTAESAYRSATGDTSFVDHAEFCADWIAARPLFLNINQKLNALVQGWTAGNLYLYGEERGRADWMATAVDFGNAVWDDYISIDPPTLLATETWAMSSGTMVWGLCNSVFRDDPVAGAEWVETYGAYVDTFQVWYDNAGDSFDWDNSWNVAYANAHFAMSEVSGDPVWSEWGVKLARQLLSYDSDDDGGIPATTQDPVTEDMSWVTSYLGKFGVDRLVGTPPQVDAGVLAFLNPTDGGSFLLGESIPIRVEVSNFGLEDLAGVEVRSEGALETSTEVDLPFASRVVVELDPGWIPATAGEHELLCRVVKAGDEEAENDTLAITVTVTDPASTPISTAAAPRLFLRAPSPNPARGPVTLAFAVPADEPLRAELVSVDARVLRRWDLPAGTARIEEFVWDGNGPDGRALAAGVYFVRARSGGLAEATTLVRVR